MPLPKSYLEKAMREIRNLYRHHEQGDTTRPDFIEKATRTLRRVSREYDEELFEATAKKVIAKLREAAAKHSLELEFKSGHWVRDKAGLVAVVQVEFERSVWGTIFIGPKHDWQEVMEEKYWFENPYLKKNDKRWQSIDSFDFETFIVAIVARIEESLSEPNTAPF